MRFIRVKLAHFEQRSVGAKPQIERENDPGKEEGFHSCWFEIQSSNPLASPPVIPFNGTWPEMQEKNAFKEKYLSLQKHCASTKNSPGARPYDAHDESSNSRLPGRASSEVAARDFVDRSGSGLAHDRAQLAAKDFQDGFNPCLAKSR